jgi:hypothetical protein
VSDTPRTDKESFLPHDSKYKVCDADFARTLERELNAANERIKQLEYRIHRASMAFFRDGSDGQVASGILAILEEKRRKP